MSCTGSLSTVTAKHSFFNLIFKVLGFALLVSAGYTVDIIQPIGTSVVRNILGSAGWLVFVSLVVMIYEGIVIIARFVNFNFINNFTPIVFCVVRRRNFM